MENQQDVVVKVGSLKVDRSDPETARVADQIEAHINSIKVHCIVVHTPSARATNLMVRYADIYKYADVAIAKFEQTEGKCDSSDFILVIIHGDGRVETGKYETKTQPA